MSSAGTASPLLWSSDVCQMPPRLNNSERALVASVATRQPTAPCFWGTPVMPTPSDPHRRRRTVRIQLDPTRHSLLEALAAEADVNGEQLAGIWLRERLDAAAGIRSLVALGDTHGQPGADRPATGHEPGRRTSLHGAIVEVLEEHGGPMTAAEIAESIRSGGAYRSPRSAQPITGAAISRRVANPYYRDLFERDGRHLDLANRPRSDRR